MEPIFKYLFNDHPEATATVVVLIGGIIFNYRLQRKNLLDSHRVELYKKLTDLIRDIQKNIYSLSNTYQATVDSTANIGDKYLGKDLDTVINQVDEATLKKDVDDHFDGLKKVITETYETKHNILELLVQLTEATLVPKKLTTAVKTLHLELNDLDKDLQQTFELIKLLDPLPKSNVDLLSPRLSVEHFRLVLTNVRLTNEKLTRFNSLITDFKIMLHNDVVGHILGKKKEQTSADVQLTRNGLADKRVKKIR